MSFLFIKRQLKLLKKTVISKFGVGYEFYPEDDIYGYQVFANRMIMFLNAVIGAGFYSNATIQTFIARPQIVISLALVEVNYSYNLFNRSLDNLNGHDFMIKGFISLESSGIV